MKKPDPLALDRQLCFALYAASHRITRLYRPLLEPLGLTYPQYLAMLALWQESPTTVGALCARLKLDTGTLTPLLKRLQTAGLVERRRDESDERRVNVALTDQGRALRARAATIPGRLMCESDWPVEALAELRDRVHALLATLPATDA